MRTIFILLLSMLSTQACAFEVMSCKIGKKYFGVFVPSWNQMDMPRFIIDVNNKQFRADEGPWVTGNNELSETFAKGLFFQDQEVSGFWMSGLSSWEIDNLKIKKQTCKIERSNEEARSRR